MSIEHPVTDRIDPVLDFKTMPGDMSDASLYEVMSHFRKDLAGLVMIKTEPTLENTGYTSQSYTIETAVRKDEHSFELLVRDKLGALSLTRFNDTDTWINSLNEPGDLIVTQTARPRRAGSRHGVTSYLITR